MLYTLSNYTELYKKEVALNDTINFEFKDNIYKYTVKEGYLYCNNEIESKILHILLDEKLIGNSIDKFCSSCYGYPCTRRNNGSTWPDYKSKDYTAATKIIITIFELLATLTTPCKTVELTTISNLPLL